MCMCSFSADIQTPTEIEELKLRTPRPVASYLCESEAIATRFCLCESEATQQQQQQHTTE
ncbi:hypothetical protein LAV73_16535 [Lysinibacillus xylanilyticus]|uniref:hypothetical protein n=1 Tax=Lysinibacillus xylanilyticus TaxID=582475 RepID=UPI002B24C83C|nr:hypothetical protein [Lysinibacillus xylanilyticus]MEB2281591.1 hypothetical protein [Lysinibacillus xylanilyticus]